MIDAVCFGSRQLYFTFQFTGFGSRLTERKQPVLAAGSFVFSPSIHPFWQQAG
jgi:hypothetical protein